MSSIQAGYIGLHGATFKAFFSKRPCCKSPDITYWNWQFVNLRELNAKAVEQIPGRTVLGP